MSTETRGITPYRASKLRFDYAENTLREPPFNLTRDAKDIAKGHAGQEESTNWHYLDSGAIAVRPWQDQPANLHAQTDTNGGILRLSDYQAVPGMVERPTFRAPTDLPGVTVGPTVQATGDYHQVKTVNSDPLRPDGTFAQTMPPDIAAWGQIETNPSIVSLDRVAISRNAFQPNQPFLIRIIVPSGAPHYHQTLGAIYFGGPISQNTTLHPSGAYAVEFMGDGRIKLHMWKPDGTQFGHFAQNDSWQGFRPQGNGMTVYCRVWPHYAADGTPVIEFRTDSGWVGQQNANLLQSYYKDNRGTEGVHTWYGWKVNGLPITGRGPLRVDIPRDLRVPFQLSLLQHLEVATIRDDNLSIPFFPTTKSAIQLSWRAFVPSGTLVVGKLYDVSTDAELSLNSSGANYRNYRVNRGQFHYYAKFTLTPSDDGFVTPILYKYKVDRVGIYDTPTTTEQTIPSDGILRNVSISGPDKDFTHETAALEVEDPSALLTKINIRGRVRTRLQTEYHPTDASKVSVLIDGFAERSDGKLKGWIGNQGLSQGGSAAQYPNKAWKNFAITFNGMWQRLREKLTMQRINLAEGIAGDVDSMGVQQPYKVTDICRSLLSGCGFSPDQIDVPDNPIRFFPGTGDPETVEPLSEIGSFVANSLHDYLGWFLVWDANAGTGGMWRAVAPTPLEGPYTPLAKFTLDSAGAGKLQMRPESYGSVGWYATQAGGPGTDVTIPTVRIRKKTYQTHVKRPEANAVHVTGTGQVLFNKAGQFQLNQWAWNPKSYDFFVDVGGDLVHTADPTDPDYIGEFIPLVIVNTSLSTQHTVDILTRRYYDAACRSQKWVMFEAPLALVLDKNDTHQSNPRPLRYYDAVTITGSGVDYTAIVRSCNPFYRKDQFQMAHYECVVITQ